MTSDNYAIFGIIFGIITFIAIWIYSFIAWGFLMGLAIGWLPAIIGGILVGFLWLPIVLIGLFGLLILWKFT